MPLKQSFGDNPYFASAGRRRAFKVLVVFVSVVFILRLAQLQLIEGSEYRHESDAQAIKKLRVEPFRGNIYDNNDKLFVHNEPSFSVSITPNEFLDEALPLLSSILGKDIDEIKKALAKFKNYSPFIPRKIFRDADFAMVSLLEEYNDYLPGVDINVESKRLYDFKGNLGHVLGYTREISGKQLKKLKYYNPGDVIGKSGLEYSYESMLRGKDGIKCVMVDKFGKKVASFEEGDNDVLSNNGFDLYLGIDLKLQEYAEKLLDGKRGSIVAIDPDNGEVIISVSKPDYDPRDFSGKISIDLFSALINDPGKPLLHRAIMSAYPPGSTFKMLIALAALQEGLITPSSTIYCGGSLMFGGRRWKCHGAHGNTSVRRAIQWSCNVFFYQLGLKLGLDKIVEYGKMFGFGSETKIDLPFEDDGNFPSRDKLTKQYGKKIPRGLFLNYGIGQGEILATPLQMTVYTASIANKGTLYQPHTVRSIYNNLSNKREPLNYAEFKMPIKKEYFDIIHDGMYDVVNRQGGTALSAYVPGLKICGKTGTAQNPHGKDHAWFVCFAPKDNPRIAMTVFVENSGFGGAVAAPIAGKILKAFFYPDSVFTPKPPPPPAKDSILPEMALGEQ